MGMLEDDLQQFPPRFEEQPRKVHLYYDNHGETFGLKKTPFANTLCKMNSTSAEMQITHDPNLVTCKICRKDRRFRALVAARAGIVQPAMPTPSKPALRTRYRRNWRGKLILQVEELVPFNYDERDPYQIEPGGYHGRWRDATLEDLGLGIA